MLVKTSNPPHERYSAAWSFHFGHDYSRLSGFGFRSSQEYIFLAGAIMTAGSWMSEVRTDWWPATEDMKRLAINYVEIYYKWPRPDKI
jgi:hypothetical protein